MKYKLVKEISMDWTNYINTIEDKKTWKEEYWLDVGALSSYFEEVDENVIDLEIQYQNKNILIEIMEKSGYWWISYKYIWKWRAFISFRKYY